MPQCSLCGRAVLPLRSAHFKCRRVNEQAGRELVELATRWLKGATSGDETRQRVEKMERDAFLHRKQRGELLRPLFEAHVQSALEDDVLTVEEESQLVEFVEIFSLGRDELDGGGWYTRFVQCGALRDLLHGKLPQTALPFRLEADEALIWLFQTAQLTEGRLLPAASESGVAVSIPVSTGLYYRVRQPARNDEERDTQRPVDVGSLGVTNRHIHFAGRRGRVRLRLEELEGLRPTHKGVRFRRPGGSRSEGFETGDSWFLVNILTNARNAHSA